MAAKLPVSQFVNAIPRGLKRQKIWVGHDANKVPLNVTSGLPASTTDPQTWGTWSDALAFYAAHQSDPGYGVGIVLDGMVGIDFDHLLEATLPSDLQAPFAKLVGSTYVERSPSGEGMHALIQGALPPNTKHLVKLSGDRKVEMWSGYGRYLTVTGHRLSPHDVTKANGQLDAFVAYFGKKQEAPPSRGLEPERLTEVRAALQHIDPDCPYPEWIDIGMALRDGLGDAGLVLFDEWSAKGSKYVRGEPASKWSTFTGTGRSLGTIFYRARKSGFIPEAFRAPPPEKVFTRLESSIKPYSSFTTPELLAPVRWVMEPYLPRGEVVELHGPHGTFKSTVALWMVLAVASGTPFFGRRVTRGKAAFLSLEDGDNVIAHRVNAWLTRAGFEAEGKDIRKEREESIAQNFFGNGREGARFLTLVQMDYGQAKEITQTVDNLIADLHGFSLVVIETSARLAEGPEDNPTLARLAFALERIASRTGACVLLIRHVSKEVALSGTQTSYGGRGGGALADAARGVLSVALVDDRAGSPLRMIHSKAHALGPKGEDFVLTPKVGAAGLYFECMTEDEQADALEVRVLAVVTKGGVEGVTRTEVRNSAKRKCDRELLLGVLDRLVLDGRVLHRAVTSGSRYYSVAHAPPAPNAPKGG